MAKVIRNFLLTILLKGEGKISQSRSKAKVLTEVTGGPEETTQKIEANP